MMCPISCILVDSMPDIILLINLQVAYIAGRDIEYRVSNNFLRRVFGIKGHKFPVNISHQMVCFTCGIYISFICNEELLSSRRDFRPSSSLWEVAIALKSMTGIY